MDKPNIDEKRAIALDRAFIASRLLDEKYFPRVMNALNKAEKGEAIFKAICNDAGIPKEMQEPLWDGLQKYAISVRAPWAPF